MFKITTITSSFNGVCINEPSLPTDVFDAGQWISAKACGLDDVFPPDDHGSGPYTHIVAIYTSCNIAAF